MMRKLSVMALDTPARDQPVASVIGCRNTASDIMAPTATQLMRAPIPTITQPYWTFITLSLNLVASPLVVRRGAKSTSRRPPVAVVVAHPFHLVRHVALAAALRREIEQAVRAHHHL